jgi:mannosyltransferase
MTQVIPGPRDSGPPPSSEGPSSHPVGLLLVLLGLAALVRLPGLGHDLWIDEIATVLGFVHLPFDELLTRYPSPNHQVLYSALARISLLVFGEEPWAVRLPAYLFGVATVPALYILARVGLTRIEALGASAVFAFSYHHAYFSQNARGYTGYIFLSVLGTFLLVHALRTGHRRFWAGFAVTGALNVYILLSGLFVVVSQVLGALVLHIAPVRATERRRRLEGLVIWTAVAAGITLLLYAPLMRELIGFYLTAEGEVGWRISGSLIAVVLEDALPTTNPWLLAAGTILGLPVLLAGVVRLARRMPLAFFAFLLPPALELIVSAGLGAGSYPRRFILIMPLAVLVGVAGVWVAARAVARWSHREALWRPLFAAGVVAGAAAVALPLPRLYTVPKQDFRGALEWVDHRATAGDLVVAAWVAAPPSRYFRPEVRSARTRDDLQAILDEERRTWLLTTFQRDMDRFEPDLANLIRDRFDLRETFPGLVGGGAVLVWERRLTR